jgi:outer membrane protein OmpA-like peptidoglycan-associated protein
MMAGLANAQTDSPATAALEAAYDNVAESDAPILAPRAWAAATRSYERALKNISTDPVAEINSSEINETLTDIGIAQTNADTIRPLLTNLLQKRALANVAGSPSLATKLWNNAEKQLIKLTGDIERGRLGDQSARQERSDRIFALYDQAELEAITNALLIRARGARALALVGNAEKLAPVTYRSGEETLQACILSLQQKRYDNPNAEMLADTAEAEFKQATQITLVAQQLKSKQLTTEQFLLLWEARLLRITDAAGLQYDALEDWDTTVDNLVDYINDTNNSIANLQALLNDGRSYIASIEEELRIADERLGGTLAERDQLILIQEQQARSREKLMQIEQLFEPSEASILQERKNIILRLTGLQFASGSSKLDPDAIALLAKVQTALDVYPDSAILVEGHTDANGPAELNARLSDERANTVMRYMISEMKIAPRRLNSVGFGSNRPIALNTSATGRAKNRRIDLIITPVPDRELPERLQ